jgi:multiple sugar transport system substrate-binding protein
LKRFCTLLIALALIGAVTRTTLAADPIPIRIFVGLGIDATLPQKLQLNSLANVWNTNNPDIRITFDYYDNKTALAVLLKQIADGTAPDIVGPAGIRWINLIRSQLVDLGPFIAQEKDKLNFNDYDASTLKLFEPVGGKNVSIPLGIYPSFLWVNEDVFTAAGVPLPPKQFGVPYRDKNGKEYPWNWYTLADVAKKLTVDTQGNHPDEPGFTAENTVVYGFADFWLNFRNAAVRWDAQDSGLASDGRTATFNQKAFRDAAQWYHDAIFRDRFMPKLTAQDQIGEGTSPFESGKLAMWYSHTWYQSYMSKARFQWGIYAAPSAPSSRIIAPIHADSYAIWVGSVNQPAAWKVIQWLNSPMISWKLCKIYGCTPIRKSARAAWEREMIATSPNLDLMVVNAAIQYLDIPSHESFLPDQVEAEKAFNQFWQQIQMDANMGVVDALDKLNTQLQSIFDNAVTG